MPWLGAREMSRGLEEFHDGVVPQDCVSFTERRNGVFPVAIGPGGIGFRIATTCWDVLSLRRHDAVVVNSKRQIPE